MRLLSIDTTGAYSSVALYDGESTVQIINEDDYSHLQRLVPCVKELMEKENLTEKDIDAIAVSRGPGSFTGIRIGMATAKGLAQIWNKPIVEVPTLASFAFREYEWIDAEKKIVLVPIFDAKRHQVYAGAYKPNNDKPIVEDGAYDLSEFLGKLKEKSSEFDEVVFFGDGIEVYFEDLDGFELNHSFAPEDDAYQTASGAAHLGYKLFAEGKHADCFTAQPEYLRQAEAERKLAEKIAADGKKFGTTK